jgi:hypothetical protein
METQQSAASAVATAERWINLKGVDGKTRARLNLDTGELVIRDRGVYHRWSLRTLLEESACHNVTVSDTQGLNAP